MWFLKKTFDRNCKSEYFFAENVWYFIQDAFVFYDCIGLTQFSFYLPPFFIVILPPLIALKWHLLTSNLVRESSEVGSLFLTQQTRKNVSGNCSHARPIHLEFIEGGSTSWTAFPRQQCWQAGSSVKVRGSERFSMLPSASFRTGYGDWAVKKLDSIRGRGPKSWIRWKKNCGNAILLTQCIYNVSTHPSQRR